MSKTVTVGPLTRVEGHGKVTIVQDDGGDVLSAHLHMTELRGFEKLCQGRMLWELPTITARICGICPVSHHLASAKACDDLLGLEIPKAGMLLRELMHMGQMILSHAVHFFFMAGPDLFLPSETNVEGRSIFGMARSDPSLVDDAIQLRGVGQRIVERVGGRSTHPSTAIPGGVSKPLCHNARFEISDLLAQALPAARKMVDRAKAPFPYGDHPLSALVAPFPSQYMALHKEGDLALYDGEIRVLDRSGAELVTFAGRDYQAHIGERVDRSSYGKSAFYRGAEGILRVNSLARLNVCETISTELASEQLHWLKALCEGPVEDLFFYHVARAIELLYCVERAQQLIDEPDITSPAVRVPAPRRAGEGVGVVEAPRGTLVHHYVADEWGRVEVANFVVATVHNVAAIDRALTEVAKTHIKSGELTDVATHKLETVLRAFDPCLSCATHAVGSRGLDVRFVQDHEQKTTGGADGCR